MVRNAHMSNHSQYPPQPIYENSSLEHLGASRSPAPTGHRAMEMNTPQAKFKHNKNILNTDGKVTRD